MKSTPNLNIIQRPSPNFGDRKNGAIPDCVIIHFTAMDSTDAACERLCDPQFEVSAHYVVAINGDISQLVDERNRAWHAGASRWGENDDINSSSIGIEMDNNGGRPFTEAQYRSLIALLADICARHSIPADRILGHQEIAPGRKFDPGPWFDWARLDEAGVSAPPKGSGIHPRTEDGFRALAASAGYDTRADIADLLMNIRIRHGATPFFSELRDADYMLLLPVPSQQ